MIVIELPVGVKFTAECEMSKKVYYMICNILQVFCSTGSSYKVLSACLIAPWFLSSIDTYKDFKL